MDNREPIAIAVNADTGKITWCIYDEPWKNNQENEGYCLAKAMNEEVL